jgi:hypothetical protein
VGLQLEQLTQASAGSATAQLACKAAARWQHWPLSVAFASWRSNAAEQVLERTNEKRASTFLYFALTLKALTGFKWAVQDARVDSAAGQHRQVVTKRSVLRAWRVAALYLKVRIAKLHVACTKVCSHLLSYQLSRSTLYKNICSHRHNKPWFST